MKNLIKEIHRRSLWQVLGIYLAGSWIALQVVEQLTEAAGLPDWVRPFSLVLLVLGFPIVMATARQLNVNPAPFVLTLMVAAGSSFLSPVAYQTNLMVYGPGGYKFIDFVRLGAPLTLLVAAISTIFAPLFFPFHP